ncbi:MAG: HAMP domain-containing protein [Candidatus Omnitrophica bacterium]|nr:HAMP domain-containing protein [Candidatus Omnitrophota bacterium]
MAFVGIRRKKYFVERGLQLRFARFVILYVFIASVLTGLTTFYTTFMMLGERLADVYPQGRVLQIFRSAHTALLVDMLVILPLIFYGSIVFSHRIAGPLPKIYQALKSIGEGRFDVKIILRKHDELKDLADGINDMAARLRERELKK